jgi:hypothetical protein
MLDTTSSNYALWRDLMLMALTRYSLTTTFSPMTPSPTILRGPGWTLLSSAGPQTRSLSIFRRSLESVVLARATCGSPWRTSFSIIVRRTLHLDAAFHNFVQGDLSMTEYCRKFEGMADALADLGSPNDDRILDLNILRGLNQCFEHLGAIIRRSSPFPNFLKVRDDLLLEEIHLDTARPSATPTALYTSTVPLAPKPQPSASS